MLAYQDLQSDLVAAECFSCHLLSGLHTRLNQAIMSGFVFVCVFAVFTFLLCILWLVYCSRWTARPTALRQLIADPEKGLKTLPSTTSETSSIVQVDILPVLLNQVRPVEMSQAPRPLMPRPPPAARHSRVNVLPDDLNTDTIVPLSRTRSRASQAPQLPELSLKRDEQISLHMERSNTFGVAAK